MKPVADENDVVGLPRNSFHRFGRIQAVMVCKLLIERPGAAEAGADPSQRAVDIGKTDLRSDVAGVVDVDVLINPLRLRLDEPAASELEGIASSSEAAAPCAPVFNVGRPRLAVELMS